MRQRVVNGKVWWVERRYPADGCKGCAFFPKEMDQECGTFQCATERAVRLVEPHELPAVPDPAGKATNPKEVVGDTKVPLALVPDTLSLFAATAFCEGAVKYGSYNWRVAGVRASTYKSAAERHIKKWWNGEECDPKTKVRHLANAIACLAILLDADVVGKLNDDRPPKADLNDTIEELEKTLAHLKELHKDAQPQHCFAKAPDAAA